MINEQTKAALADWLEAHTEEFLEDLKALVAIDSERGEAKPGMPYGEGPAAALAEGMKLLEKYGFAAKNYENYVITGDLNDLPKRLDVLAHLDVVPAGDGWTKTDAFTMLNENGRLYGRGVIDDKGPALCAMYALRAIRDLGIELKSGVRLIMGADEECGSSDIAYYFTKEPQAEMSISPDANFPLIFLEKGGVHPELSAAREMTEELPRVISVDAGVKVNVVPNKAKAVVEGFETAELEKIAAAAGEKLSVEIDCTELGEKKIEILVRGREAHAASPDMGINALTALLAFLAELPLAPSGDREHLRAISRMLPHGDNHGHALGVDLQDETSGQTTFAFTMFTMDESGMHGIGDIRACISANDENTTDVINKAFAEAGFVPGEERMYAPHYVPKESELVQKLLEAYEEIFEDKKEPIAIGGGTYVHHIDNGVAFGIELPGWDHHMHGADEFVDVAHLMKSAVAIGVAVIKLCS